MSKPENREHPIYSGVALSRKERRPFRSGRKFGKFDFGRFENLVGSAYFLGKDKIGDVQVACRFLFRESRWGVLSPDKNPGGIVYLDLTFTEPRACRLKSTAIKLTLNEEDEDLHRYFNAGDSLAKATVPVHIIKYGPQSLHGQTDEVFRTENNTLNPRIDVTGLGGVSAIERNSGRTYIQRNQWKFSCQSIPNRLNRPTTLEWDLIENRLDKRPRRDNTFHTAFAFEHDGQPFFMQIRISGYLEGTTPQLLDKAKRGLKKKLKFGDDSQSATTLVNFGGRNNPYQDPLDELVENIPFDMMKRNQKPTTQIIGGRPDSSLGFEIIDEEESSHDGPKDNPHDQPSPPVALEEIREEALALLSLDRPLRRMGRDRSGHTAEILSPVGHGQQASCDGLSTLDIQVGQSTHSSIIEDQGQDEETPKPTIPEPNEIYEEFRRLLNEASIPMVLKLIMIWLLGIGTKISLFSGRNSMTRAANT
ncbi:hypothetical protein F4806DRAFT_265298 [Annulohypoxylon nitens]|nr:hypothetical protein F4806DRAFT_265298 [Annulohypoxylon nitens]